MLQNKKKRVITHSKKRIAKSIFLIHTQSCMLHEWSSTGYTNYLTGLAYQQLRCYHCIEDRQLSLNKLISQRLILIKVKVIVKGQRLNLFTWDFVNYSSTVHVVILQLQVSVTFSYK